MQVSENLDGSFVSADERPPLHGSPRNTTTVSSAAVPPLAATSSSSALRVTTTGNHSFVGGSPSRTVSFVDPTGDGSGGSPGKLSTSIGLHRATSNNPTEGGAAHSSPYTQGSTISGITDFGWEDCDGQSSMSGYSAYSGRKGERRGSDGEGKLGQANTFYMRLVRFYKKYNPEKLSRVEEFLTAYRGEEEQLFTILSGKYGPEPPVDEQDNALGAKDADARSDTGSMYHFAGQRWVLPKTVTALQGGTDVDTPYWPGNRLIGDVDLLALLKNLRTDNEELSRCFLGVLAQHPTSSFNGVVYVTKAPLPTGGAESQEGGLFLGHHWAGRLANNKSLVHQNANFSRTVLHCTEACRNGNGRLGAHERWRLSIYVGEGSPLSLYRAMWDPVLDHDAIKASGDPKPTTPSLPTGGGEQLLPRSGSEGSLRGEHSSSASRRQRPVEQPMQPTTSPRLPLPGASAVSPSAARDGAPAQTSRPLDDTMSQAVIQLVDTKLQQFFSGFESSVIRRLNDLDKRVGALERKR